MSISMNLSKMVSDVVQNANEVVQNSPRRTIHEKCDQTSSIYGNLQRILFGTLNMHKRAIDWCQHCHYKKHEQQDSCCV